MIITENRIDRIASIAMIALLITGCFVILQPFFSAILWAIILSFSTWSVYLRIEHAVGGRKTLASALMVFIIALVLILPLVVLGASFADNISGLLDMAQQLLKHGLPNPPLWLKQLPMLGTVLFEKWQAMAGSSVKLTAALTQYLLPLRSWALQITANLGQGILYLSLSVFITFFFYRDGKLLSDKLIALFTRIGGCEAANLLHIAGDTIKSVVYGILGTALAQGFLAGIGFAIAGVPSPLLLGILTCFFSLVPIGPPLIWIPASLWLFQQDQTGWAIFLAVWGVGVVSMIDNVLKPYFISQGSHLPFVLIFLGIFGGVLAFGLVGVFLGPTLIAIAYTLFQKWCN
jgi:predicted PurR-regulated permease PerM